MHTYSLGTGNFKAMHIAQYVKVLNMAQGIVAVGANPSGGSGRSPSNASPATNASPSPAAQPSPSPALDARQSTPPTSGTTQNQQGSPVQAPVPQATPVANPTPTPASQAPQQTRSPGPQPRPIPGAAAATPQAQPLPDQAVSPSSPPAAPPSETATVSASAPAVAPGTSAQALDSRNTVVDAVLRLQGPGMWPFGGAAQDALLSALGSVMTGVPRSSISFVAAAQVWQPWISWSRHHPVWARYLC